MLLLAASALLASCSKVCGSDEPAAAERLLQFDSDVIFDDSIGIGAGTIRDAAIFEARWEHLAETYDIGPVPEVDFTTSQVAVVQSRCHEGDPGPNCAEVLSVTVVEDTTVFRVCGSADFDCPYCRYVSEVWRTDITPVEACEDEECGGK
jgi:hypothetical protein